MKQVLSTLSLLVYRLLDSLKQKNPFWWAIVQGILWLTFILISMDIIPSFGYKEVILVFLGSLISGVGSRTTHKLNPTVSAEKFKLGFEKSTKAIEESVSQINVVKQKPLSKGQWVNEKVDKKQIVLHHSVSSSSDSIINGWNANKDRVGTSYSIDKDGTINQHFPDDEWAYHLYVNAAGNRVDRKYKRRDEILNKESIGIELVSLGGLTYKNGEWYSVYNKVVPIKDVYVLEEKYRGFKAFEKYTDEQIVSLEKLLILLFNKYPNIKQGIKNNYSDICQINNKALNSEEVLTSHSAMRTDKSDIFPQKEIINMLSLLKNKIHE